MHDVWHSITVTAEEWLERAFRHSNRNVAVNICNVRTALRRLALLELLEHQARSVRVATVEVLVALAIECVAHPDDDKVRNIKVIGKEVTVTAALEVSVT